MKYYLVTDADDNEVICSSKSAVKRHFKTLPSFDGLTVWFYWWYRDDLVECIPYEPDVFLATRAKTLSAGATNAWAMARGLI